jgi:hypothetical protein
MREYSMARGARSVMHITQTRRRLPIRGDSAGCPPCEEEMRAGASTRRVDASPLRSYTEAAFPCGAEAQRGHPAREGAERGRRRRR